VANILLVESGCKGTAFFSTDKIFTKKNAQKVDFI